MQKSEIQVGKEYACGKEEALMPRSKCTQRGQCVMMITDINGEDRLVPKTFPEHLERVLGWDRLRRFLSLSRCRRKVLYFLQIPCQSISSEIEYKHEAERVLKLAKHRALEAGRPLSDVIQEAIVHYLSNKREKAYQIFCKRPIQIRKQQFKEILEENAWDL